MDLPEEWEKSAVNAVGDMLGKERLDERIKEIQAIIERLDFRWDMGYLKQEEYVEKREELKAELAQLQPIPQDELIEAHRLLKNFAKEWSEADVERKQRLLKLILQRVWVCDDHLCAIMLRPSYYVSVHQALKDGMIKDIDPAQLPPFLQKENGNFRVMESCRCGSDGHPSLITICKLLVAPTSLVAVPFQGCVADYSMSLN